MSELVHAPAQLTARELVDVLDDVREGVLSGDTLEGFVEFTIGDEIERWDVRARYRVGNLMGQGGMRMIGELVPRQGETT